MNLKKSRHRNLGAGAESCKSSLEGLFVCNSRECIENMHLNQALLLRVPIFSFLIAFHRNNKVFLTARLLKNN